MNRREQLLDEITTIMGTVLNELERREGYRTKNLRVLREFVDAFCEEYKQATITNYRASQMRDS